MRFGYRRHTIVIEQKSNHLVYDVLGTRNELLIAGFDFLDLSAENLRARLRSQIDQLILEYIR